MIYREIQLPDLTGIKRVEFSAQCGQQDFVFALQWSTTLAMWFLSCTSYDGSHVWESRPLVANAEYSPPIDIATDWVILCASNGGEPTQENLGPDKACTLLVASLT